MRLGDLVTWQKCLGQPEEMGIIPRAAEHIFTALQGEHVLESTCTVSYLEIYNEVRRSVEMALCR